MENQLLDYIDDQGTQWVMAACGHRCGGGGQLGQKIAACPNCQLLLQVLGRVAVIYPERLPEGLPSGLSDRTELREQASMPQASHGRMSSKAK